METQSSHSKWQIKTVWLQSVCLESPYYLPPWIMITTLPPPQSVKAQAWQDSSWKGSGASIHPQGAALSSESPNYLSPSLPPLPLPLTLPMIRKHTSSLKSISPSCWHKLKLAVARAVNSVGSQLIIFVNWKIDFFLHKHHLYLQDILLNTFFPGLCISTENNQKQMSQRFPFIWPSWFF